MRFSEPEVEAVLQTFDLPSGFTERLHLRRSVRDLRVGDRYDGVELAETDTGYRLDVHDGTVAEASYAMNTGILGVRVEHEERDRVYLMRPGLVDPTAFSRDTWTDAGETVESLYWQKADI